MCAGFACFLRVMKGEGGKAFGIGGGPLAGRGFQMKESIHLIDYSTTAKTASAGVREFTVIYECLEGAKRTQEKNCKCKALG